jgi:hypothetical protein
MTVALVVAPAKAGAQVEGAANWVPACAGTTAWLCVLPN